MRKVSLVLLGLVFAVWSSPAGAQAARTWVSGTGLDTNPCTRAAPCATFAVAFAATLTGGEISVVDSGAYGSLTINKAISITNDGAGEAGIVVSSTNAIIINAGTADVNLRGLVLNGQGSGLGIHILAAGRVSVQNCLIQQFGTGINVATNANDIKLHIQDTTIINSTNGFSIQPGPGIIAHVVVDRSRFSSNTGMGVNANGAFGGSIQIAVTNSVMSNNQHGFVANGGSGGTVRGLVSDSLASTIRTTASPSPLPDQTWSWESTMRGLPITASAWWRPAPPRGCWCADRLFQQRDRAVHGEWRRDLVVWGQ